MDYRDKLHKNKGFLTTPIGVAFLAAGLMLLSYPVPVLAAASTIEAGSGGRDKAGVCIWNDNSNRFRRNRNGPGKLGKGGGRLVLSPARWQQEPAGSAV